MKLQDLPARGLEPAGPVELQADIAFARDAGGDTGIRRQRVRYPFHLGRVLRMAGDPAGMASVYLQSCSGGIFQSDDLRMRIVAGEGASAHVTSAASTVVHGMVSAGARQTVEIDAAEGALLEYLPDPLILFPRSRLQNCVEVRLDPRATVIFGETLLLHDPAGMGGAFDFLESATVVRDRKGAMLACDRFRCSGGDLARALPGINGAYAAQATLFAITAARPADVLVDAMRRALAPIEGVYAAASALPGAAGAWIRVLGRDAIGTRAAMHAAWSAARSEMTGRAPMPRRK